MSPEIFINYRRDDSIAEAGRIQTAIAQELGHDKVFLDTCSIELGQVWPKRIEEALRLAKVVIVVIGNGWLKISDDWGRRRIDQENDWVRKELEFAITTEKYIIPVLVSGGLLPPSPELLPQSISVLLNMQAVDIRSQYWDHDILLLSQRIKELIGDEKKGRPKYYPGMPSLDYPEPIGEERLEKILRQILCEWTIVKSIASDDQSRTREELHRTYEFKGFKEAIDFMNQVAQGCEMFEHHPRWENIWNKIHVYLSTWGKDYRVTDRDIRLARYLDKSYRKFSGAI
jgi:pterin-4a-carbinolamine dehydratase